MNRVPVASSNLKSVGYDPQTLTLEVEFKMSGIYRFFNVPESVYNKLMAASSLGTYFSDHIKDKYKYSKL